MFGNIMNEVLISGVFGEVNVVREIGSRVMSGI